jgi:outer membrane protein TolC
MINQVICSVMFVAMMGFLSSPVRAQQTPLSEPGKSPPAKPTGSEGTVRIELQKSPIQGDLPLTVSRAVELALERSPILTVEKIKLEQAREKIGEEKGNYDPLLNIRGAIAHRDNVVASTFYPTGLYVEREQGSGINIETKTYTGGRFTLGVDYKRLESSSQIQTLSPQYSANFGLTFTHALLRDFGWDVNMTRIRVAEKGEAIAVHSLAQRVAQLIQQVEEGYWGLYFLREDLQTKRASLEIARGLLKRNEDLLRAGRVAPVSVLEAKAGVASREEGVITAENDARKFEDRLKLLLQLDLSKVNLTPVEKPDEKPVSFDLAKSVNLAFDQRPEIQGLQQELEQREIELRFADNQTLPRLDFTAQYGMNNISGTPNPDCLRSNPISCNLTNTQSPFAGKTHAKDAFDRIFSHNPFDNWSVELKLQIPLGNRTANAQYSEANLRLAETRTRLRAIRDQIEGEVRDAMRDTLTAGKRIEAARETIKFVDEQLDATRRKLEAGLSSSYDVLQVLDDLDKARTTEHKAVMDYNVGQSKFRLAEGSNLEKYNIELKKPPRYVFEQNK